VLPLAIGSLALVVHPSVRAATVAELVALAKASPGKMDYGSPGKEHPTISRWSSSSTAAGIDLVHVPYKGSGPAVSDLLGGQIAVMFLPVHLALPQAQGGKLRILASVAWRVRVPLRTSRRSPKRPASAISMRTSGMRSTRPAGTPRDVIAG
jgi:tripartite-type tricarboxylate transporter receptor subunit TctC